MVSGVGIDIVEVDRVSSAFARFGERFSSRILGDEELSVWRRRAARTPRRGALYLATRFAAKEAIAKALGLGLRQPMTWRRAQILNAPSGQPIVRLEGPLAAFVEQRGLELHVSVADERAFVIAIAIAVASSFPT